MWLEWNPKRTHQWKVPNNKVDRKSDDEIEDCDKDTKYTLNIH